MTQAVMDFMVPPAARRSGAAATPKISELPPSWKGIKRIGWDLECCDPTLKALGIGSRRGGYICGYSFAIEDGPAYYVPLRHHLGGNVEDPDQGLRYFHDRMKEYDGTLFTCGGAFDQDYYLESGGTFHSNVKHRDVAINAAIINEHDKGYGLDSLLKRYDLPLKDEDLLRHAADGYGVDPKGGMWRMPGWVSAIYGTRDSTALLDIARKQEPLIEAQDLWGAIQTESDLLPVVVAMRRRGVKIHQGRLEQFGRWLDKERNLCFERFYETTGVRISSVEFRSAKKFDEIVKKVTGKELPRTPKGTPKIDEDTIASIAHPAFKAYLVPAKNLETNERFYDGIVKHMTNGRIHTTFKQLVGPRDGAAGDDEESEGARFGRMASNHPNMQNQPSPGRNPIIGGRLRSIYIPDVEDEWVCADFSQQEPRWVIHWAEALELPGAAAAASMLRSDPKIDPYKPMVDQTGLGRDMVKILYLAQSYNQGEVSFCRGAGLPVERYFDQRSGRWKERAGTEGRALLDQFNDRAPYIRMLSEECRRRARARGYIRLWDGQRSRFLQDQFGNYLDTDDALNRLAQGNGARQTKLVLIAAHRAGLPLQLVVHDDMSLSGSRFRQQLIEIMQDTVKLSVPMRAKEKCGRDYADASGWGSRKLEDGTVQEYRPDYSAPEEEFMESFAWVNV